MDHPRYEEVRDRLLRFAELEKSPARIHTYRISPISIWNAAALGVTAEEILKFLEANSRYGLPKSVLEKVTTWHKRYGALVLERLKTGRHAGKLAIVARDAGCSPMPRKRNRSRRTSPRSSRGILGGEEQRGAVKQALTDLEYPVEDLAGYVAGAPLAMSFRAVTRGGIPFQVRQYQIEAVDAFHAGSARGSGVIVLPCGAGRPWSASSR